MRVQKDESNRLPARPVFFFFLVVFFRFSSPVPLGALTAWSTGWSRDQRMILKQFFCQLSRASDSGITFTS